ncbi:MAG: THUMP domain-containing protein [Thermoplasmatota archaeon]
MCPLRSDDLRSVELMTTVLVRFAELGLKSERVRSRFLQQLADDIEESLIEEGVEHVMDVRRSRIFIQTGAVKEASDVLRQVPGVFSFSLVEEAFSEKGALMEALSRYGAVRIRKGMTYGLKVRRTGSHPYSSQEIAVEGGGAVISHLKEGDASVDLKSPDVWIEVEIRERSAYIFDNRTKGMGGMPASSQGKVLLYLPEHSTGIERRSLLSYTFMRRRGCKVIPAALPDHSGPWTSFLERNRIGGERTPFILHGEGIEASLMDAVSKLRVWGIVLPFGPGVPEGSPVMHADGTAVSQFYPTISMSDAEVEEWLERLLGGKLN